jgi:hypothetical protein
MSYHPFSTNLVSALGTEKQTLRLQQEVGTLGEVSWGKKRNVTNTQRSILFYGAPMADMSFTSG